MSEYQYYEFQAIDRPLTKGEMAALRALSTRARITPTRFRNVYNWGDFRDDPLKLMQRCFDAFVYIANWGTNRLMFRFPSRCVDAGVIALYCVEPQVRVHVRGEHVVLEFYSRDEDAGTRWIEDEEAEGWLPSLLPLRSDLMDGDLRSLYIGWLAAIQAGMLDDAEMEPPVPPGLRQLSAALRALAEFLRVDDDLLAVAARGSAPLQDPESSRNAMERWIRALPDHDKDAWLLRLMEGSDPYLRIEMLRRFRQTELTVDRADAAGGRTVGELLGAARARAENRLQRVAERKTRERAAYLENLAARVEETWLQVEAIVQAKRSAEYVQAVELLKDLHELAVRQRQTDAFGARLAQLCARYPARSAFMRRLREAGLDFPSGQVD